MRTWASGSPLTASKARRPAHLYATPPSSLCCPSETPARLLREAPQGLSHDYGQHRALVAWRLTPWIARARLAQIGWRRGRPPRPDEHVNWQVWGQAGRQHTPLWRTFLTEQRALLRELGELEHAIPSVQPPALLLADPQDALAPVDTGRQLARALPDARLQLVPGAGHNLPRRAPDAVADAITAFLAAVEDPASPG